MPGADSCAVMEGENEGDMEDEVVYTKPSLLGKLKAIASKVGAAARLHFHSTTAALCSKTVCDSFVSGLRETERTLNTCSSTRLTRRRWCGAKGGDGVSGSERGERLKPQDTLR